MRPPDVIAVRAVPGEIKGCAEVGMGKALDNKSVAAWMRGAQHCINAREIVNNIKRGFTGDADRVVHRVRARFALDDDAPPVVAHARGFHRHGGASLLHLHFHDGVAGAHLLQAVGGGDVAPGLDLRARGEVFPFLGVEWPVELDDRLRRALRVGQHRLRRGFVRVADFENPALALRPVPPVRRAAVAADHEIALRRDRAVHGHHAQPRDGLVARHVTRRRLHHRGAPELAARLAGDDGVARPELRPEAPAARRWTVEAEPAGALMLRRVVPHARLIDHVGEPLRMPRRKTVVPPRLDVEQLVEGVAVRHPCRAFLIRAEKIAVAVPLQRHDVAQPRGELLHFSIFPEAQQTAAPPRRGVVRAGLVGPVGIRRSAVAHRHVKRAVRSEADRHRAVHAPVHEIAGLHQLRVVEVFVHRLARVRHAVAVGVAKAHDLIG